VARGGNRAGSPGKAYPNRTDMHQPVKAAPGGEYGQVTALKDAQKVIPLPTANVAPPSTPSQSAGGGVAPSSPVIPGTLGFEDPTNRPNEPVTAGLPVGPGPGPEVLGQQGVSSTDPATVLRSIYANVPQAQNNDVLRLIEAMDKRVQ